MEKELYIVEFASANYAGGASHCLVWATSEDAAEEAAWEYAENYYYEEDGDQLIEDGYDQSDACSVINWAELVEGSEFEEFVKDPSQAEFYPEVNSKE